MGAYYSADESMWDDMTRQNEIKLHAKKVIVRGNANPEYVDGYNCTPLIYACYYNLKSSAISLIRTGNSKPEHLNNSNETALLIACRHAINPHDIDVNTYKNDMEDVTLELIRTGKSKPGHVNHNSVTALILACMNGMEKTALALIDTGLACPEYRGYLALTYAEKNNMTVVCNVLAPLKASSGCCLL